MFLPSNEEKGTKRKMALWAGRGRKEQIALGILAF